MSTLREQGINPTWLLERLAEDGYAELEGDFTDRTALRTMAHRVKGRVGEGKSIKTSLPKPTVLRVDLIDATEAVIYRPRNQSNGEKPEAEKTTAPVKKAQRPPLSTAPKPQAEPVSEPTKPKRSRKAAPVTEGPLAEALADKSTTRRHRQVQEKKEAAAPPAPPVEPGTVAPGAIIRKSNGNLKHKVLEVRPNKAGTMEVHCVECEKGRSALRVFLLDAVVLVR